MIFRESIIVSTMHDKKEITKRLNSRISKTQLKRVYLGDYNFWGYIRTSGFEFVNYVHPRFAFTVLVGRYSQNFDNTLIELVLKVNYSAWWIILLIEGLVVLGISGGDPISLNNLIGYIFPFAFPLLLLYIKFRADFKHAMKFINDILDTDMD